MTKEISRRRFIRQSGVAAAAISLPSVLGSCARGRPGTTTPEDQVVQTITIPYAEVFEVDDGTIRRTLGELTSRGADSADLYFQRRRSSTVLFQDGIVSRATSSVERGVGLRCVVGERTGYAYSEELVPETMLEAARTAASIAEGPGVQAPQELRRTERSNHYEPEIPWSEVGIDRRLPFIRQVAELARGGDPSITRVEVRYRDDEELVLIADMSGRLLADLRPMTRLWVTVTAERDGERQSNSANISARAGLEYFTEERLQWVARRAVERTMILFEARRPPAGEMPVVLVPGPSGILLHEAIGHGMEADFNRKGISIYSDMIGRQVAEPFVTIIDDGTLPHARGSLNLDDEGRPGERTVLVEDGRLVSYLHDGISARHYGVDGTGSGRRESFRYPPMPRMRCTYMDDGPHSRDEIIASVSQGIMAETFTNGQVRIGAGDYTFYIKNGWLIEDGRVTAPIRDCNIIGNGPETLRNMTMVANDSELDVGGWTCGKDGQGVPVSLGIPTLLISSLTVGGENA